MSGYAYASTRVRSREKKLLKKDQIKLLVSAATAETAIKQLWDFGYPEAPIEQCISRELNDAYAFIRGISPDPSVTDLFFLQYDYHNAKCVYKAEYLGKSAEDAIVPSGTINATFLTEVIREKSYRSLPREMTAALVELDKAFTVRPDISLVDLTLDRAYSQEVKRRLEAVKENFVHSYYAAYFDYANMSAVIRIKRIGGGKDMLDKALMECGDIPLSMMRRAFEMSEDEMLSFFAESKYHPAEAIEYYRETGSFAQLVKARDDYLISLSMNSRHDMFSISPVMAYLVGKQRETSAVNMVMVAKSNGIPNDAIESLIPKLL